VLRALYFTEPTDLPAGNAPREATDVADSASAGEEVTIRTRMTAAAWVVVALALLIVILGLVPLFAGLTRLVGLDPVGVFTLGPF